MFTYLLCALSCIQSDILSPKFALEWMSDFEKLQEALDNSGDDSYMNSLNRSLALVLDEFYNALTAVGVSAASGDGMPALFKVGAWVDGSVLFFGVLILVVEFLFWFGSWLVSLRFLFCFDMSSAALVLVVFLFCWYCFGFCFVGVVRLWFGCSLWLLFRFLAFGFGSVFSWGCRRLARTE